jgi:hypothetical protein
MHPTALQLVDTSIDYYALYPGAPRPTDKNEMGENIQTILAADLALTYPCLDLYIAFEYRSYKQPG